MTNKKFFHTQEYFVDSELGNFDQAEIMVSLEQNFMDVMTFVPVIEILETGLENLSDAK